MRTAPLINDLWVAGGPFHGADGKPHSRVTVQLPWDDIAVNPENVIFPESIYVGLMKDRGIPLRWYQRYDNNQIEMEVPNIKSIGISRSIDADAATCRISMYNQWMYMNGEAPLGATELGQPGYFTPTRGVSPQAQSRWGQETNDWEDILVPNAVLRTYQGFGGTEKTIAEAITDGNIILTGVWLIDQIDVSSDAMFNITCRDMMKLLIEQQLYPPLVPQSRYPLKYYRYIHESRTVASSSVTRSVTTTVDIAIGDKRTVYADSSVDRWYPSASPGSEIPNGGYVLHGHRAIDCLDGDPATFCLSVGNSRPTNPFAVDMWEFDCGEHMNAVYMHPWGGNYTMYVSVMENGVWQGTDTVPYFYDSNMNGGGRAVDTGVDIPYVAAFGVPWETAQEYILPRVYHAQKVRVAFANPTQSQWGPYYYRSGMREFRVRASNGAGTLSSTSTVTYQPLFYGADSLQDPNDQNRSGYMTVSHMWQVDAFGECRTAELNHGPVATAHAAIAVRMLPDGSGYYVCDTSGQISSYGTAVHYGDPYNNHGYREAPHDMVCDMAVTHTGLGYWVLTRQGEIYSFGDAPTYNAPAASGSSFYFSMDEMSSDYGLWVMDTNGVVTNFGAAVHYGNWNETVLNHDDTATNTSAAAVSIQRTYDDDGYWILTDSGRIDNFGAAGDYGQIVNPIADPRDFYATWNELLIANSSEGYAILRGDGHIQVGFGDFDYFGAPIPGSQGQIRKDGNYKDYSDIIRELVLWSGFLLWDDNVPANEMPPVFGNIETTGSFSEPDLPDEIFDKRPVIDAINELKETVGYICFVDDEGGFRFESPNWWSQGNFDEIGQRLTVLPEVDERVNMSSYSVNHNDTDLRSVIIISSEDPDEAGSSTLTTRLRPATAVGLRGLEKPAMWVNGFFQTKEDQTIMAELISMHIWFAQRMGQVQCVANPCIQINDQVRIYERQTSEAYIHYVRGIDTDHDLDSGRYMMTLTTHWLGDGEEWVVNTSDSAAGSAGTNPRTLFLTSPDLTRWLNAHPSPRIRDSLGILSKEPQPTTYSMDDIPDVTGQGTP